MKIETTIYFTFPDEKRDAFINALSEKLEELDIDGWGLSRTVMIREFTDKTIKTQLLMLSNKQEEPMSDEKIRPFFDGIYYCPWTGLDHCVSDKCKDFADCPVREQEETNE